MLIERRTYKMTWGEMKRILEEAGIRDEMEIEMITFTWAFIAEDIEIDEDSETFTIIA
jgi:hypothetical protein